MAQLPLMKVRLALVVQSACCLLLFSELHVPRKSRQAQQAHQALLPQSVQDICVMQSQHLHANLLIQHAIMCCNKAKRVHYVCVLNPMGAFCSGAQCIS